MDQPEKKSALESLEDTMYSPKKAVEPLTLHSIREEKQSDIPTTWSDDTPIIEPAPHERGFSFGAKMLLVSSIILLGVLAFAGWRILSEQNVISDKNIALTIGIPAYVEGGETNKTIISIANNNKSSLLGATLTLLYKQGAGAQDEQEKIQVKQIIGDIPPQGSLSKEFEVTLYGSEAETRDVTAKLEYKVQGSNAVFSKVVTQQVVIKSSPIAVAIVGPSLLSVGQFGAYTITVTNNTSTTTVPSVLLLTLPANFTVDVMNPPRTTREAAWPIGPLAPGEAFKVMFSGAFSGTPGEVSTIRSVIGSVGSSPTSIGAVFTSQTYDVQLRASPLVLTSTLDTERGGGDTLQYGDKTTVTFTYKNTSSVSLHNVSFVLGIGGTAALTNQIDPMEGYYDSTKGTVTWTSATNPMLATVDPGAEGTFRVRIPIILKGTNSPKLSLSFTGTGDSVSSGDVVSSLSKSWVVQGSASLAAATRYKNASFQNMGPIPPQANVDTTYAVHLLASAQNALTNAQVSFVLPLYVTWRNVVMNGSSVSYDPGTRTVTWNIGNIDANKTAMTDIGVSVRPSQSHVGGSPSITSSLVLDANESVSLAHLHITVSPLTTAISGESWPGNPSVVVGQ